MTAEQMTFPDTFDEFAKEYGFKDKEEVYTNGSELIPVFRVKQWLQHIAEKADRMTAEEQRKDDIQTMRILFNADIEELCNQHRFKDAWEMRNIRDRLIEALELLTDYRKALENIRAEIANMSQDFDLNEVDDWNSKSLACIIGRCSKWANRIIDKHDPSKAGKDGD